MNRVEIFGNRPDMVKELIRTGRYDLIPASRMSKRFEDENPWPPPQFTDDDGESKFCTWCGERIPKWLISSGVGIENPHGGCLRYGKHCRHKDLDPAIAYYMRVWSFGGSRGRHHYDPNAKQALMIQNLNSGELQLISPKQDWSLSGGSLRPSVQFDWEREDLKGDPHIDEDDLDDCVCDCEGCNGFDVYGNELAEWEHCGDHFLGCHEEPTVTLASGTFETKSVEPERFKYSPGGSLWDKVKGYMK